MLTINTHTGALKAGFALNRNLREQSTVMQRLATGKRINSGKDGPAALISSVQLEAQIKALEAQSDGLERSISNANISDGHMSQLSNLYNELGGLVVAGADGTLSNTEREGIQLQIDTLTSSIQRITGEAVSSLDGVGMASQNRDQLASALNDAALAAASVASGGANDLASGNFEAAQTAVRGAGSAAASARGSVGAYQKNTLEPQLYSNQVTRLNLIDSKSRISDTDFALEASNLVRSKLLVESGIKVLQIANQQAKAVLKLLA